MIRTRSSLTTVAALLTACGSGTNSIDAGPDAVDATIDLDGGIDTPPGPLDGTWSLTWECVDNCGGFPPRPALTYSDLVDVAGVALHWHDETCIECVADHVGMLMNPSCISVPAVFDGNQQLDPYIICETGGSIDGTLTWAPRFGPTTPTTSWRLRGTVTSPRR